MYYLSLAALILLVIAVALNQVVPHLTWEREQARRARERGENQ